MPALATVAFVAASGLLPPIEVARVSFGPPFEIERGGERSIVFHPSLPLMYALSDRHLFVVDAVTGETVGGVDLSSLDDEGWFASWELALVDGRLLGWSATVHAVAVFGLDDPESPELIASSRGWRGPRIVTLAGSRFGLLHTYGFDLVDVHTLQVVAAVPRVLSPYSGFEGIPVSGGAASPVIAVVERAFDNPSRYGIAVHDVLEETTNLRFVREVESSPGSMVLDGAGDLLVAAVDIYAPTQASRIEVIDARAGTVLASWQAGPYARLHLSEAEGRRLVVVLEPALRALDESAFAVVDLADPRTPRVVGRFTLPAPTTFDGRRVAVSGTAPIAFAAMGSMRGVAAVDLRTVTEFARLPVESGEPLGVVLGERAGARLAAVTTRRFGLDGTISRGGRSHLDLADLSEPSTPRRTGRFLRNHPGRADAVAGSGGRYAFAYEIDRNALAVVDLSRREVTQVTGAADTLGSFDFDEVPELRAAGRFVALAGWKGWERFEIVDGRLEPLDARLSGFLGPDYYEAVELGEDGRIVALGWNVSTGRFLEVVHPDGRAARAPRRDARLLRVSPPSSLDRVAVAMPEFSGMGGSPVDVWDVGASGPRVLWSIEEDVAEARFDATGTRLLVSGPLDGATFVARHFDAATGEPSGAAVPEAAKYYYHGYGAQWLAGASWRAIYWVWTYGGWNDVVVDLTGPDAGAARRYDYEGAFPEYAPRETGGWYSTRRDPWANRSEIVIGDAEGRVEGTGPIEGDHFGISALRRGAFATASVASAATTVSLWRDPNLNRPPVVVAEGDRTLECVDGGALAQFDASGSWDPDSSPGTRDDLTAFAWSVDGESMSSDATVAAVLPPGEHDVAVEVRDALGASSSTSFVVAVGDHTAPEIQVSIGPAFDGAMWDRAFHPSISVVDACDAAPRATMVVRLPEGAEAMEVSWERAASPAVEIRLSGRGPRVVLVGPDEASLRGAWAAALRAGGVAADPSTRLVSGGDSRTLAWRFESGRAVAYAGRDLVVSAAAVDASGNAASASASLSAARQAACKALPLGSACVPR